MDRSKIRELFPNMKFDEPLGSYNTLGINSRAQYLVEVYSIEEIFKIVQFAKENDIPYKPLGFGSNVVFSDQLFEGIILVCKNSDIDFDLSNSRAIVNGGTPLSKLILEASSRGLCGLETHFGIPATVAGALINNAGAHGVDIGSRLISSTILFSPSKIGSCKPDWFDFKYRGSKLKANKTKFPPIILSSIIQLQRRKNEDIVHDISKFKKWRLDHQPIGQQTCGSIFKNPFPSDDLKNDKENSAGYILDEAGAKKFAVGDAHVYKAHANWIINHGNASGDDVRRLIDMMRSAVNDSRGVNLEEEVEYVGEWS